MKIDRRMFGRNKLGSVRIRNISMSKEFFKSVNQKVQIQKSEKDGLGNDSHVQWECLLGGFLQSEGSIEVLMTAAKEHSH